MLLNNVRSDYRWYIIYYILSRVISWVLGDWTPSLFVCIYRYACRGTCAFYIYYLQEGFVGLVEILPDSRIWWILYVIYLPYHQPTPSLPPLIVVRYALRYMNTVIILIHTGYVYIAGKMRGNIYRSCCYTWGH